jgi:chromosome partitioning protein
MKIISIGNQKGGVAKTATAANLGAFLAESGYKVLLADLDPQGSLTMSMGVGDQAGRSIAEVINNPKIPVKKIILNVRDNLDLIPSDIELAVQELLLVQRIGRESVIKRILDQVKNQYDLVIIDTPPNLGILTVNALVASHGVISPVQATSADLRGLRLFIDSLESVKELNPDIVLIGVLVTMFDTRLNHHQEALEVLKKSGLPVFSTIIGRSIRISESMGVGQPLNEYDPNGTRTTEYKELTSEVIAWLKN